MPLLVFHQHKKAKDLRCFPVVSNSFFFISKSINENLSLQGKIYTLWYERIYLDITVCILNYRTETEVLSL